MWAENIKMQQFVENTEALLNDWRRLKDKIVKSRKELAENVQSIKTLELNFGKMDCITKLQLMVKDRNEALTKEIKEYDDVFMKLQKHQQTIKKCMKNLLDNYTKVTVALNEDCDEKIVDDDQFAVEIAKISYSNLLDNHSLRADPPIAAVLKDDYRWIRSVFSEDKEDGDIRKCDNTVV
jgi:phosphotransferase system IIB component